MHNTARILLAVAVAAGATVVSSGPALAQANVPATALARQLTSPDPGPPPDCKHHPSFPGCKKKPVGSSPAPTPKP